MQGKVSHLTGELEVCSTALAEEKTVRARLEKEL